MPQVRNTKASVLGRREPSGWAMAARGFGQLYLRHALAPKAAYGEPAGLKDVPPFVHCFFLDVGLPCFLGGTVQEPLGPMHFCCQDDTQADTCQRGNRAAREEPKHSASHFCLHEA